MIAILLFIVIMKTISGVKW